MVLKISRGGQISVPAEIRNRWHARELVAEDHGDHLILRPASDDPIEAVRGIFAHHPGPSSDQLRREAREEDVEREARKYGHLGRPGNAR